MSVAFVKEPNDSQVEVLPDRELGTDLNLVTPRGLTLIEAQIAELQSEIEQARAVDDKIAIATLSRDLRYWTARRSTAEVVADHVPDSIVHFGDAVTIERDDGRRQVFRIVGLDEADPNEGRVSYVSPLARSLVGKGVGDVVKAGSGEAEIVAIEA